LARARAGIFTEEEIRSVPGPLRQQYFTPLGDRYQIAASLRNSIEFGHNNMLRDPCPSGLDLLVCRNVVIYFADEEKQRLFYNFFRALRPVWVGSTERVAEAQEIGFVSARLFFQRPLTSS
jgi:chemotaxis protein methyltransferase CheR